MRVLVVDDNEMNRDLLTRRLARQGHDTATAVNGRDALARLAEQPFDLVLLDITMPEMDGYEVLARMHADAALSAIPVIMVSAIDEVDSVVRCLELGAEDYLSKPFNPLVLKARVDASLARKRLHDQQQQMAQMLLRELEIGRQIQAGFLPERLPQPPGWRLAARFVPARQVAGDFYDAFELPDGGLALVIADVCDKGVGAALYMALFRSLLRVVACQATPGGTPARLQHTMSFINDYMATVHERANMFATVFFAVLDPASGRLDHLNAGHDAPLLRRADGRIERLEPQAPALGLMPGGRFEPAVLQLAPGDLLLAYTDGVTDAVGTAEPFGEPRLLALLAAAGDAGVEALLGAVVTAVDAHGAGAQQHDDVTLLALQAGARPAPPRIP